MLGYDIVDESLEVRAQVGFASEVNILYEGMTVPRICRLCRDLSRDWDQDLVDHYIGIWLPNRFTECVRRSPLDGVDLARVAICSGSVRNVLRFV